MHTPSGGGFADYPDRSQLQQIIAGITEGVILIEPDQAITYANEAALAMHKVESLDDLGRTVDAYERNFVVRYRTTQVIDDAPSPIQRVVTGEMFEDVVVEVAHRDRPRADWVHRIRSLVVTTRDGMHDCWVLVMTDVSGHLEAEERFERIRRQPSTGSDLSVIGSPLRETQRRFPLADRLKGRRCPRSLCL